MRLAFLTLGVLLVSCASQTTDDLLPDATGDVIRDVTVMDTGKTDSSIDATFDAGGDASSDGSNDDADAGDDGSMDSGIDTGILDAGPDGSICPPCQMNFACCMVMKSMNYGKCTNKACLACCM